MKKFLKVLLILFFTSSLYSQSTLEEYFYAGVAKYKFKDHYGAIADYTKAIELDTSYTNAYHNRGLAKNKLKDYYGAIADYSKAIELDPNYTYAYNNRGNAKNKLKDYYGAIADYIFMASAVADYLPNKVADNKMKRSKKYLTLDLKLAPDILISIKDKTNAVITAFALETQDGEKEAKRKLREKGVDFMVLNYANEEGAGFDSSTNRVIIFSKDGNRFELNKDRKDRISEKIIAHIIQFSKQNKTVINS